MSTILLVLLDYKLTTNTIAVNFTLFSSHHKIYCHIDVLEPDILISGLYQNLRLGSTDCGHLYCSISS